MISVRLGGLRLLGSVRSVVSMFLGARCVRLLLGALIVLLAIIGSRRPAVLCVEEQSKDAALVILVQYVQDAMLDTSSTLQTDARNVHLLRAVLYAVRVPYALSVLLGTSSTLRNASSVPLLTLAVGSAM